MKTLVAVEGQTLRWYGKIPEIADNSVQFVQLEFSLPEDWADLVVVAQFSQTKTYNRLLEDGCCYLPAELVAGPCEVSLFGQRAGENVRATSVPLRFKISRSGFTSTAETPIPPTPDLYAQLLEKLGHQGPSESVSVEDDSEGNVSFAPGFEGDGEDHELNSLNTGKTVYTSFPDKVAREGLKGKLANPGGLTPGNLLRVKSVDQDGSILLEGVDMPEGPSVTIDTTLTQPGQAADAKATGDAISKLSQQNLTLDTTLTQSGKAADAKATGDEIKRVEGLIPSIEGLAKTEDIPKVPNWAMQTSKPGYTASEVGADPKGTAAGAVSAHNTSTDAHTDLRLAVQQLQKAVEAFMDVDDATRNSLSEVLALIDANADVIESITTGKVSVSDIINNLTTNVANKPLSAAQGVVLKTLIDGLSTGKLDASALQSAINTALAQAKASGAFDGAKGDPGRGIKSITRTSGNGAAGATDTYTITYTDGTTSTLTVQNGSNGAPGYTPKRKIDYWTDEDQEAIVQQVIAALGTPVFGRVDANNNIILTGELADGTYTIKYEDAEGNVTEIGTLEQGATSYTNLADPSSADWLNGQRLNSSGEAKPESVTYVTNYIPLKQGDVVRVRGLNIYYYGSGQNNATTHFYAENKTRIATITPRDNTNVFGNPYPNVNEPDRDFVYTVANGVTMVTGDASQIRYARFVGRLCAGCTVDDVIITVNQEITE